MLRCPSLEKYVVEVLTKDQTNLTTSWYVTFRGRNLLRNDDGYGVTLIANDLGNRTSLQYISYV